MLNLYYYYTDSLYYNYTSAPKYQFRCHYAFLLRSFCVLYATDGKCMKFALNNII